MTVGKQSYVKGLNTAFARGKQDALADKFLVDCPYGRTDHRLSWLRGYEAGRKLRAAERKPGD